MRIFFFSCDFLYTVVRVWVTFQLLRVLFKCKRNEKIEKWIHVIVTMIVAGLNTYNDTLGVEQFYDIISIFITIILCFFSKYLYQCKGSNWVIGSSWILLSLLDILIQSIIYKILIGLELEVNIFVTVSLYRSIYFLLWRI